MTGSARIRSTVKVMFSVCLSTGGGLVWCKVRCLVRSQVRDEGGDGGVPLVPGPRGSFPSPRSGGSPSPRSRGVGRDGGGSQSQFWGRVGVRNEGLGVP